ncbi:MAG: TIGR00725 family protein [Candidatus Omnitrophica bacterium]|nr:TIGR00725 family protein [Candidatus Omnitrophota bacterium]
MAKVVVGVIGSHKNEAKVEQLAHNLGKKLAEVVDNIVCGGLSGVMEAVCKGFKEGGGQTIGIIPCEDKAGANKYCDIIIPTGMGLVRNVLVVKAADILIALPGEYGTLSEIAYGLQYKKPVIGIDTWDIPGVIKVDSVEQAVAKVRELTK